MKELNLLGWLALGAVIVGGMCWGLVGIFNISLVTALFGNLLGRLIYIGIGAGAGYLGYQIYLQKFKEKFKKS